MATKLQAEIVSTSTNYDVKVESVRVYATSDSIRYRVMFDKTIPGIATKVDQTTGEIVYEEAEINYIDFQPKVLIAQCLSLMPGLTCVYMRKQENALRAGTGDGFGAAQLSYLLQGANITIERTKFVEGEVYTTADGTTAQHRHDGYSTRIADIEITANAQKILDKAIENLF